VIELNASPIFPIGLPLLIACGALLAHALLLDRDRTAARSRWIVAWAALGAWVLLSILADGLSASSTARPALALLAPVLASLAPAVLWSGAWSRCPPGPPRWLLPALLAVGILRALLFREGLTELALNLGIATDALCVVGAGVVQLVVA